MTKDDIVNALYYGDCLEVMRKWPDGFADLVYLDPPFNSNADYNILFGKGERKGEADKYQAVAFQDTWQWNETAVKRVERLERAASNPAHSAIVGLRSILGDCGMLAYLSYMAERLVELKRVVSPTGSVYLHCDPTASHYLKLLMDCIFGGGNFKNEIIWQRTNAHPLSIRKFESVTDTILYYVRGDDFVFHGVQTPMSAKQIDALYSRQDDKGRYTTTDLSGGKQGGADAYRPFKAVLPPAGRAWAPPNYHKLPQWAQAALGKEYERLGQLEKCDALDDIGLVHWTRNGKPRLKRYLEGTPTQPLPNLWADISRASKLERIYPTQKPLALLERIIKASSNEGDIVLDPFCGCGTTIDAANRLQRRWAGIDISHYAIEVVRKRRLKDASIPVRGVPTNIEAASEMARNQPFEFEKWALSCIPGIAPNNKQTGDGGIDGRGYLLNPLEGIKSQLVLAQVKGGKFNLSQFRDFAGVVTHKNAAMGVYVTLVKPNSPDAYAKAAEQGRVRAGASEFPKMQLWSIADYFEKRKPDLPPLADPVTGKAMHPDLFAG